jgi:hypothetical protein
MQLSLPWRYGQTKPFGSTPQINWSHPLAQGLVFYGYDTGTGVILDLASQNNQSQSTLGTVDPNSTSAFGSGINYGGSGTRYFNSGAAIQNLTSGNLSCACAFIKTGTVGSFSRPFGRTANNGGSNPFANYAFDINAAGGGQNHIQVDFNLQTNAVTVGSIVFPGDNLFTSAVGTFSWSGSQTTAWIYVNGGSNSTSLTDVRQLTSLTTNDAIIFSGQSAASSQDQFVGFVYYGAVWNRTLSIEEVGQLHIDPYCFLWYPEDTIFASLVGAAAVVATPTWGIDDNYSVYWRSPVRQRSAAIMQIPNVEAVFVPPQPPPSPQFGVIGYTDNEW